MKSFFQKKFPEIYQNYLSVAKRKQVNEIGAILADSNIPDHSNVILNFKKLQENNPPLVYGYDSLSVWMRAVERVSKLVSLPQFSNPGLRLLEGGCGDGMTSALMAGFGHAPTLIDMDNWTDSRAKQLPFFQVNLDEILPFDSSSFDFIYSFNVFEHVPRPDFTLREFARVVKPGGYIYLEFDPLYSSPWGLHAWRTIRMPYSQYLLPEDFISEYIAAQGVDDLGHKLNILQPLNKWTISEYRKLLVHSELERIQFIEKRDTSQLGWVFKFPKCFTGRNLSYDDLTVSGLSILFRKSVTNEM